MILCFQWILIRQIFFYFEQQPIMRLFINAPDQTGSMRKTRLTLVDCNSTNELIKKISAHCNLNRQFIIVKLKQDRINIRIVQGWPIEIYPFRQGSEILVQILPEGIRKMSEVPSPMKLLQIDEQLEIQLQETSTTGVADQKQSFFSDSNDQDWTKYFEDALQKFLDAVRRKSIEDVSNILKEEPECNDDRVLSKIMQKKTRFLLNQSGQCGRTALHWAVQQNNLELVQFLLIKSSDPNIISIDNYTPLQLSIILKQSSIFQTLISHPKIDLNAITKKGTALHLAIQNSLFNYANKLLDSGANPDCQNMDGISSRQLCNKLNVKQIKFKNNEETKQLPYMLRGYLFKVSSLVSRLKQRLIIVNPFQNQFLMFQDKVTELKVQITKIKSVHIIQNKGWTMKKQFFYFQVQSPYFQKIIFCTKNKQIGVQWVQNLRKCINFCKSQKSKAKIPIQDQLIQVLDDNKNIVQVHKRKKAQKPNKKQNTTQNRYSLFNLKPKQQNAIQQKEGQIKFPALKKVQKKQQQKIYEQVIIQSTLQPPVPVTLQSPSVFTDDFGQQPVYLRESQLLGSVISNNLLSSRSSSRVNGIQPNFIQDDKSRPVVCYKDFQILRQLGNGSFGKVFLARHKKQQRLYALKVLNKKKLIAKKQLKYAVGEASILKKVESPFIIQLHYSFQTPSNLYIAIDYCPNGDLSQRIIESEQHLDEKVCRFYIAQVVLAIQYLHTKKIIYRDLKPENILIAQDGFIRLTDFNLSKENSFSTSFCGSPAYLSPEMLDKKGVGREADIYGIGCVLYQMMVGQPPFFDQNLTVLYQNIKNGKLKFPSSLSKAVKSLISGLLQRNLKKRIGVKDMKQIKKHQFFEGFDWKKLQKLQMKNPDVFASDNLSSTKNIGLQVIKQHGFQDSDYQNSTVMINRIKNFTFARDAPQSEDQQY